MIAQKMVADRMPDGSSPSSWAMVNTSGEYMPLENSVYRPLSDRVGPGQSKRDLPRINIPGYSTVS